MSQRDRISYGPDKSHSVRSTRLAAMPSGIAPLTGKRRATFVRLVAICTLHAIAQISLLILRANEAITANAAFSLISFTMIATAAFLLLAHFEQGA